MREGGKKGGNREKVFTLVVFYALHFLTQTEFYIVLVSCLGYLIMWKTQQANELTQELKVANEQLERAAYKDHLTGLYNRKYSRLYMNQILMENAEAVFAVYSLDVNYFKPINDNYGLETGDRVLSEIGARLKALESDRIAAFRVGGDELGCGQIQGYYFGKPLPPEQFEEKWLHEG